jgi:hypothetical protein
MTAISVFGIANAMVLPMLYNKWFANIKQWHRYMLICHVIAMVPTVFTGGNIISTVFARIVAPVTGTCKQNF